MIEQAKIFWIKIRYLVLAAMSDFKNNTSFNSLWSCWILDIEVVLFTVSESDFLSKEQKTASRHL